MGGWTNANGTCYQIPDSKLNFDQAIEACSNLGGKLTEPQSMEQLDNIWNLVREKYNRQAEFLIGIYRDTSISERYISVINIKFYKIS